MLCKKCNSPGNITIKKVYCFCDECFITNIIHKFRSCIGKNTKLTSGDKVLICLSGDISSTVLLDLVSNGISLNTHKKLRISPVFIHVNGIYSTNNTICNSIMTQCKKYDVDLKIIDIANMISKVDDFEDPIMESTRNLRAPDLKEILNKVSPTTEKEFLSRMKQNIFYKIARDFECNLIFTSETNTKLSAKLLSNIVTGRGSQIENDTGFADLRYNKIKLLRPMREITDEELHHYIRIRKLSFNNITVSANTLQSLITSFISDLEINSPATISTICKTADKISSADDKKTDKSCKICMINLNTRPDKMTAIDATAFSKFVSSGKYSPNHSLEVSELITSREVEVFPHIHEELCYSCSKNYNEFKINTEIN